MNCKLIKQLIIVSYKFTATSATPDVAWFLPIYCGTLLQLSSSDAEWSFAYSNIPFTLSSCSLHLLLALSKELPRHCESLSGSLVHRRGALPLIPVPLPNIFPLWRWKHCTRHLGTILCRFQQRKAKQECFEEWPSRYLPLRTYLPARE